MSGGPDSLLGWAVSLWAGAWLRGEMSLVRGWGGRRGQAFPRRRK